MIIPQEEKFKHPEYLQYLELYERTITGLESGARGSGAPEAIILSCLKTALSFYEADSAALVEANTKLGYGVVVAELCRDEVMSFEGRIVGINAKPTRIYALTRIEIIWTKIEKDPFLPRKEPSIKSEKVAFLNKRHFSLIFFCKNANPNYEKNMFRHINSFLLSNMIRSFLH